MVKLVKNIFKSAFTISLTIRFVMALARFLFFFLVYTFWGYEVLGYVSLGINWSVLFSFLLNFGLDVSIIYYVGKYPKRTQYFLSSILLYSIVCLLFLISGIFLLDKTFLERKQILSILEGNTAYSLLYETRYTIAIITTLQVLASLIQGIMIGLALFKELFIIITLQYSTVITGLLIVKAIQTTQSPVYNLLTLWGASLLFFSIFAIISLNQRDKLVILFQANITLLKRLVKYGVKVWFGNVVNYFNLRFNFYVLSFFSTPKEVGIYNMILLISESLLYIPKSISSVILSPYVSKNNLSNTIKKFILIFFITTISLLLSVLFIINKYLSLPATYLTIALFGTFIYGIGLVITNWLYKLGYPLIPTKASICSFLVLSIISPTTIITMKLGGAVLSSFIMFIIYTTIIYTVYYRRKRNEQI